MGQLRSSQKVILLLIFTALTFSINCNHSGDEQKIVAKGKSIAGSGIVSTKSNVTLADSDYSNLQVINFGETPWDEISKLKKWHTPFMQYFTEQTGITTILNIAPDYGSLIKDIENGNVQVASFTPSAYADALLTIPDKIRYIATVKWHGQYYYKGYIFVKKGSDIHDIGDMKGRTIAFTEPVSASGFRYPLSIFLAKGINPDQYFSRIYFLGNHNKVAEGVRDDHVDIGATYDRKFVDFQKDNNEPFRIVLKTGKIPFGALAASKDLPEPIFKKLQQVLARLNKKTTLKDGTPVLTGDYYLSGFVIKDNSIYQVTKDVAQLIKKFQSSRKTGQKGHE